MSKPPVMGRCPQCSSPSLLSTDNAWRPFCSERCKLLDFGAWIEGRYALPVPDDESEPSNNGEPRQPTH